MSIFECVQKYDFDQLGRTEAGNAILLVSKADYESLRTLAAQCLELRERVAFLESREVCTVAHDNVETCGYCQRDALAARLAEAERDIVQWKKVYDLRGRALARPCINCGHTPLVIHTDAARPADSASGVQK